MFGWRRQAAICRARCEEVSKQSQLLYQWFLLRVAAQPKCSDYISLARHVLELGILPSQA
jgi:hypothetical protein